MVATSRYPAEGDASGKGGANAAAIDMRPPNDIKPSTTSEEDAAGGAHAGDDDDHRGGSASQRRGITAAPTGLRGRNSGEGRSSYSAAMTGAAPRKWQQSRTGRHHHHHRTRGAADVVVTTPSSASGRPSTLGNTGVAYVSPRLPKDDITVLGGTNNNNNNDATGSTGAVCERVSTPLPQTVIAKCQTCGKWSAMEGEGAGTAGSSSPAVPNHYRACRWKCGHCDAVLGVTPLLPTHHHASQKVGSSSLAVEPHVAPESSGARLPRDGARKAPKFWDHSRGDRRSFQATCALCLRGFEVSLSDPDRQRCPICRLPHYKPATSVSTTAEVESTLEASAKAPEGFAPATVAASDEWTCASCKTRNADELMACAVCEQPRPPSKADAIRSQTAMTATDIANASTMTTSTPVPPPNCTWTCQNCFYPDNRWVVGLTPDTARCDRCAMTVSSAMERYWFCFNCAYPSSNHPLQNKCANCRQERPRDGSAPLYSATWTCTVCRHPNHSSAAKACQYCGLGQPVRPCDWTCHACRKVNFAGRIVCIRCQEPRSKLASLYCQHLVDDARRRAESAELRPPWTSPVAISPTAEQNITTSSDRRPPASIAAPKINAAATDEAALLRPPTDRPALRSDGSAKGGPSPPQSSTDTALPSSASPTPRWRCGLCGSANIATSPECYNCGMPPDLAM